MIKTQSTAYDSTTSFEMRASSCLGSIAGFIALPPVLNRLCTGVYVEVAGGVGSSWSRPFY